MTTRRINFLLLGTLLLILAANWAARTDFSRPNRMFMPEMVTPVPYETYAPNPFFADGKTLQTPPAGTIPAHLPSLNFKATPEEALRAGEELINPCEQDTALLQQRGEIVYFNFCLPCHGPIGAGDGPVALRGFPPPAPLFGARALKMKDGQIFHVLTYGQGNMPPYNTQLSREDRWAAVAHVRQLQKHAAALAAVQADSLKTVEGGQP